MFRELNTFHEQSWAPLRILGIKILINYFGSLLQAVADKSAELEEEVREVLFWGEGRCGRSLWAYKMDCSCSDFISSPFWGL